MGSHSQDSSKKHSKVEQAVHGSPLEAKLTWLWQLLTVATIGFFGYVMTYIHQFQMDQYFENFRIGTYTAFLKYGAVFTVLYIAYDRIAHQLLDDFAQRKLLSLKYKGTEKRKQRAGTLVKFFISLPYYFVSSISGYMLLQQYNSLPSWLGGNSECLNLITKDSLGLKYSFYAEMFLIASCAKQFGRLILHVFVKNQGNFYSFTLHHIVSVFLILLCYLINFWVIGIFILVLHDSSDFFSAIGRCYIELRNQKIVITKILGVIYVTTWIASRNIIFPICCLLPIFEVYQTCYEIFDPKIIQVIYVPGLVISGMLICLEILHIVWTLTIVKYIIAKAKSLQEKKQD